MFFDRTGTMGLEYLKTICIPEVGFNKVSNTLLITALLIQLSKLRWCDFLEFLKFQNLKSN